MLNAGISVFVVAADAAAAGAVAGGKESVAVPAGDLVATACSNCVGTSGGAGVGGPGSLATYIPTKGTDIAGAGISASLVATGALGVSVGSKRAPVSIGSSILARSAGAAVTIGSKSFVKGVGSLGVLVPAAGAAASGPVTDGSDFAFF